MSALKEKTNGNVKTQPAPGPEATTAPTGAPVAPAPVSATPPAAPGIPELMAPLAEIQKFAEDIERAFGDFGLGMGRLTWPPSFFRRGRQMLTRGLEGMIPMGIWMPKIEVTQKGNEFVVSADLPGLAKDDIKVEASESMLAIQGERKSTMEKTEKGYHHSECTYGRFHREIPLPEGADIDKAAVTFKNGVLTVTVPTPAPKVAMRRLEIKDAHR